MSNQHQNEHDIDQNKLDESTFDRAMRAHYAQALTHTPANTRARLREARRDASASRTQGWRWLLASGAAAALALTIGLQLRPNPSSVPATDTPFAVADADYDDTDAAFDENPELYLWLASNDAAPAQAFNQ